MDLADAKIEKQEKISERIGILTAETWEASRCLLEIQVSSDLLWVSTRVRFLDLVFSK